MRLGNNLDMEAREREFSRRAQFSFTAGLGCGNFRRDERGLSLGRKTMIFSFEHTEFRVYLGYLI